MFKIFGSAERHAVNTIKVKQLNWEIKGKATSFGKDLVKGLSKKGFKWSLFYVGNGFQRFQLPVEVLGFF